MKKVNLHSISEVEHVRVPPGDWNLPFHSHSAEWESYLIASGTGTVRAGEKHSKIKPGDCLMCPPGEAHQLINNGDEDLVCYRVADNASTGFWHYPDSDKYGARSLRKFFRLQETGCWNGEE